METRSQSPEPADPWTLRGVVLLAILALFPPVFAYQTYSRLNQTQKENIAEVVTKKGPVVIKALIKKVRDLKDD